ncbi:MAG: hypothetical protein RL707_1430, partial [Pseudomonadota bacterium]
FTVETNEIAKLRCKSLIPFGFYALNFESFY